MLHLCYGGGGGGGEGGRNWDGRGIGGRGCSWGGGVAWRGGSWRGGGVTVRGNPPPSPSLTGLLRLGCHNIPFSDSARNLGVILDANRSTKKHVIKICQTAYFELKCISSVRRFLH